MTTRTNLGNRINRFFRHVYKDMPWTFWTVVAILLATWIPALFSAEIAVVMLCVYGSIIAVILILIVVYKVLQEIWKL